MSHAKCAGMMATVLVASASGAAVACGHRRHDSRQPDGGGVDAGPGGRDRACGKRRRVRTGARVGLSGMKAMPAGRTASGRGAMRKREGRARRSGAMDVYTSVVPHNGFYVKA
jgi:hypothetical protein